MKHSTEELVEILEIDKSILLKIKDLLSIRWERIIPMREIARRVHILLDEGLPRSVCFHAVQELWALNNDYFVSSQMSWLCSLRGKR